MAVMANPPVPTKTPLGLDELRRRTRGLGQRYRTVLLLVDGQRALGEVLNLAKQAGAAVGHFEELVRLGLIELPMQAAAPAVEEAPPVVSDTAEMTSVEMLVPAQQPQQPQEQAVEHGAVPAPQPAAEPEAEHGERGLPQAPLPQPEAPPPQSAPVEVEAPAAAPPATELAEEEALERVRLLLMELVRLDGPMFSSRLIVRVRGAQTAAQLIDLVWDIERQLGPARRSREGQRCLEQARDLLGLGNTQVAEDTRPGYLDE